MKISKQSRREAKTLFQACLPGGALDENRVRTAVQEVLAKKPRRFLEVLSHFQRLVQLEIEKRTARVESAKPLTPDLQSTIRANLAKSYGNNLRVQFLENPALLGGLRVRVGSDVYDGSVQARLNALAESF